MAIIFFMLKSMKRIWKRATESIKPTAKAVKSNSLWRDKHLWGFATCAAGEAGGPSRWPWRGIVTAHLFSGDAGPPPSAAHDPALVSSLSAPNRAVLLQGPRKQHIKAAPFVTIPPAPLFGAPGGGQTYCGRLELYPAPLQTHIKDTRGLVLTPLLPRASPSHRAAPAAGVCVPVFRASLTWETTSRRSCSQRNAQRATLGWDNRELRTECI